MARKVAGGDAAHYLRPMLILPPGTERLAGAQGVEPPRRSVEAMLADAAVIAALPVLDPKSPREIMDEINEP